MGAEARFELASLDYGPSKEPLLHSAIYEATLTDSGDPKRRRHLYTAYAHEPYCGATVVSVLGIPELVCPEFCAAPHGYCCIADVRSYHTRSAASVLRWKHKPYAKSCLDSRLGYFVLGFEVSDPQSVQTHHGKEAFCVHKALNMWRSEPPR